jgi:hypothetical protein
MFPQDFVEFLQLLIANKVEYLVVGGYAVGIHGHPRFTGDLDIWLKISDENAVKILKSVNEFGFASLGFSTEDFTTEGNIVQMGYPPPIPHAPVQRPFQNLHFFYANLNFQNNEQKTSFALLYFVFIVCECSAICC